MSLFYNALSYLTNRSQERLSDLEQGLLPVVTLVDTNPGVMGSEVTLTVGSHTDRRVANDLTKDLLDLEHELEELSRVTPVHVLGQQQQHDSIGFVFSVDNVVLHHGELVPGVVDSLRLLQRLNISFSFLASGNGFNEARLKSRLVRKLAEAGVTIRSFQIVDLLKPFSMVSRFMGMADKDVLIVGDYGGGSDSILKLARKCGFSRPWTAETIQGRFDINLSAVMIWSQSLDWEADIDTIGFLEFLHPNIPILVLDEDFARATRYRHGRESEVDAPTILHMLRDRWEALGSSQGSVARALIEPTIFSHIDNCGAAVFDALKDTLVSQTQRREPINTVYMLTDHAARYSRMRERYRDKSRAGDTEWNIFEVSSTNNNIPGGDDDSRQQGDGHFQKFNHAVLEAIVRAGYQF